MAEALSGMAVGSNPGAAGRAIRASHQPPRRDQTASECTCGSRVRRSEKDNAGSETPGDTFAIPESGHDDRLTSSALPAGPDASMPAASEETTPHAGNTSALFVHSLDDRGRALPR